MIIKKIMNRYYKKQEEIRGLYTKYQFDLVTLKKKSKPIEEINDEIRQLANDLVIAMEITKGLGMSAPQIGVHKSIIACRKYQDKPIVLINPKIIEEKGVQSIMEGCISFPDIFVKVERPEIIVVKALDLESKEIIIKAWGEFASTLIHEIKHLNGNVYLEEKILEYVKDEYDYINKIYIPTMKLYKERNERMNDNER